ncbi:prophage endopeptidase [Izhakiella capsodis]|uniref:Prophage endopeptidase n=1 Tax=Izhakiella capsodis TaxID=1367852 RepID=A0A1I5BPC4_9GAMM|nr:lysis protein [Izhakiella capsodis]SFN76497.1 prophage endopeptidase [Izhakiella capsodis]
MSFPFCAKTMIFGLLIVVTTVACRLTSYYRDNYLAALNKQHEFAQLADSRLSTITHMQRQQLSVAAIDAKYTKELDDAKNTIDDLQRDVASGAKRLRVNATCERVSDATRASGVADASAAAVTADAEQNYFRLREQIATAEKQINGLQDYIRAIQNVEKTQ